MPEGIPTFFMQQVSCAYGLSIDARWSRFRRYMQPQAQDDETASVFGGNNNDLYELRISIPYFLKCGQFVKKIGGMRNFLLLKFAECCIFAIFAL